MDESIGSQYALQVALNTMKERCQQFQERLTQLEEENIRLRTKVSTSEADNSNSISEINKLRQKVAELTEQKEQLINNKAMVAMENKHLWERLSKLMYLKQSLDSKLNTVKSPGKNLESSLKKSDNNSDKSENLLEVNGKISLDLEDISLKLISSIAKEKSELELQCSQMMELQSAKLDVDNYGFSYLTEEENDLKTFNDFIDKLKKLRSHVLDQNEKLKKSVKNLQNASYKCKICERNITGTDSTINSKDDNPQDLEEQLQMESLVKWATPETSSEFLMLTEKNPLSKDNNNDQICPMCSKLFYYKNINDFETHVLAHFVNET